MDGHARRWRERPPRAHGIVAAVPRCRGSSLPRFLALFAVAAVRFLMADRAFVGEDGVAWLLEQRVPFRIRIKAGAFLTDDNGIRRTAKEWFALRACRCKPQAMRLWGLSVFVGQFSQGSFRRAVFVGGKRLREEKYRILISKVSDPDQQRAHQRAGQGFVGGLSPALEGGTNAPRFSAEQTLRVFL